MACDHELPHTILSSMTNVIFKRSILPKWQIMADITDYGQF
jgi:hypothetical protein